MTNNTNSKKLLAKAFFTEYAVGENHLAGWEAKMVAEEIYRIKRADGTTVDLKVGQDVPNVGVVSLNDNGNLSVGKYTVVVGENLEPRWAAKTTRKKYEFYITSPANKKFKVEIGGTISGIGIVNGIDEHGNLSVGSSSIAMESKIKELKLLIYDTKYGSYKNGYNCHFNLILPDSDQNMRNGIPGVFFPAINNKPAKFCEFVGGDQLIATAIFWPSKDKTFSVGSIKSLDQAIHEKAIYQKMKELSDEAKEIGISPDDNFEYVRLSKELKQLSESYTSYRFTVSEGKQLFGMDAGVQQRSYSR